MPISAVGTWPVMTTIGIESISASVMPVTALVAPGPEVTRTTPGLPGRARIALGGVGRGLLVADEDVLDPRLLEQRVIDRQHRAARIAEHILDAEVGQGLNEDIGTAHIGHVWSSLLRCGAIGGRRLRVNRANAQTLFQFRR